jgi:murein DD-endopeptidase MepM/ murein hydrolase activator NlpD
MKLYLDYKKLSSFIILGAFVFAFSLMPMLFSRAQTVEELQNKISQKDKDIAKIEEEIKIYQKELEGIGREKNSLSKSIKELDVTKKKLVADINVTQKKIDKTNLTIQNLSSDINTKERNINHGVESIKAGIQQTSEFEDSTMVEILLSQDDFSEIWNDIDNIVTLREKIRSNVVELKEVKVELEDTRAETIDAKNELIALKSKLSDQQKVVVQNTNEKNKLLKETQNNEANYQKLIKEQLAKKEAFEKELRDYETQLKFILDPSKLPSGGILSWPLESIFVTQEFGAKTGPHRTYASGHSGTDFRARTPLPVYAMADGVIKGTGDTDTSCPGASFGKWILVEYNNGLSSTFAHLSFIKVREGQKVKRGEEVGYTGGTGRVTGPHLHVSLYVSSGVSVSTLPSKSCPGRILKQPIAAINAYLDPMFYLLPIR